MNHKYRFISIKHKNNFCLVIVITVIINEQKEDEHKNVKKKER